MNRVTSGKYSLKKKNKIKKITKGYKNMNHTQEQIIQSLNDAYIGRKLKKRNFRSSWILHINSACKILNISYSIFLGKLRKSNLFLNRKMLSYLISKDFSTFNFILNSI
jgi:large subunit ribosomal protein L20